MNKPLKLFIGSSVLLLGAVGPSHAGVQGGGGAAAFGAYGHYSSPLTVDAGTRTLDLSGTVTGTFALASGHSTTGALTCSGTGKGTESLSTGTGTMHVSCSGPGAYLYAQPGGWTYSRVGTTVTATGPSLLVVQLRSAPVAVTLSYELVPGSVPLQSFTAEGTLAMVGGSVS